MQKDGSNQGTRDSFVKRESKILLHWQALEHENLERSKKWYAVAILVLAASVGWAVYTRSLVMIIVFLLSGTVGYMQLRKRPRVMDFIITEEGIVVGKEIYAFEGLNSFWIFYETEGLKVISLHTKSSIIPYVHIPLGEEDPVEVRRVLLEHIPEKEHELGIAEILGRFLGM